MKDEIFKDSLSESFSFNSTVAGVFDDMISRSVPFYKDILELSTDIAASYLTSNDTVYDFGCSTGSTLFAVARKTNLDLELIGIDNSSAMLEKAKQKADFFGVDAKFIEADIYDFAPKQCKCVFANFTLQFIRPPNRLQVVQKIYDALEKGGIFLFAEKVISTNPKLSKSLIDIHHTFKKQQGYSELEIMRKREAIENILVPYTQLENEEMAKSAGFEHVECVFRYCNFALFVAIK